MHIVRFALTVALLYGVYTETGPWTTIALTLVFIGFELIGYYVRRASKSLTAHAGLIQTLWDRGGDDN